MSLISSETKSSRSPYFSLADPALLKLLLSQESHAAREAKLVIVKPRKVKTISKIFGTTKNMSDDSQVQFLLAVLKHSRAFEPDWRELAEKLGTHTTAHNM